MLYVESVYQKPAVTQSYHSGGQIVRVNKWRTFMLNPPTRWQQIKYVFDTRSASSIYMTPYHDCWFIVFTDVSDGSVLPRFFFVPPTGATRILARDAVTFDAEKEGREIHRIRHPWPHRPRVRHSRYSALTCLGARDLLLLAWAVTVPLRPSGCPLGPDEVASARIEKSDLWSMGLVVWCLSLMSLVCWLSLMFVHLLLGCWCLSGGAWVYDWKYFHAGHDAQLSSSRKVSEQK